MSFAFQNWIPTQAQTVELHHQLEMSALQKNSRYSLFMLFLKFLSALSYVTLTPLHNHNAFKVHA